VCALQRGLTLMETRGDCVGALPHFDTLEGRHVLDGRIEQRQRDKGEGKSEEEIKRHRTKYQGNDSR
jgi:hypothetical protein